MVDNLSLFHFGDRLSMDLTNYDRNYSIPRGRPEGKVHWLRMTGHKKGLDIIHMIQ